MKIFTALLIFIMVFAFAGCGGGRDSALVGAWQNQPSEGGTIITLEFNRDGTGAQTWQFQARAATDDFPARESFESVVEFNWHTENDDFLVRVYNSDTPFEYEEASAYSFSSDGGSLHFYNWTATTSLTFMRVDD
ncbi:MAG: hypothetical protein FWC78_03030 [Defluviitaleaceae bacterium]|nr:hypothetical protein [Defluviitaleaceae bacterium]